MTSLKDIFVLLGLLCACHIPFTYQNESQDFYSSVSGLEEVLSSEYHLIGILENFVKQTETKVNFLKRYLQKVQDEHEIAEQDVEDYVSNPINAYLLIKRMIIDWAQVEYMIGDKFISDEQSKKLKFVREESGSFPQLSDLSGASMGISRLQDVYKLPTSELANGRLNGVKYSKAMTGNDCFQLAYQLYEDNQYHAALDWFTQAEQIVQNTTDDDPFDSFLLATMLTYKARSYYEIGETELALSTIHYIIDNNHEDENLASHKKYYEDVLESKRFKLERRYKRNTTVFTHETVETEDFVQLTVHEMYEQTCRQELTRAPHELTALRCKYVDNGVPFLKIAPFKMEEQHLDPYVVVYHDVVYDSEIAALIEEAEEDLQRSKVGGDSHVVSKVRTSKQRWLYYELHDFLTPIRQRLIDLTGMDLNFAEALQVANYGIGGHYGPHYDFFEDPKKGFAPHLGNRFVTALFYLKDVEQGGGTAFPFLKTYVPARKGSLLYWFNLQSSLDKDYRTKHAGCPVIKGCKWILNQWIHERGQEFLIPCSADFDPVKQNTTHYNFIL